MSSTLDGGAGNDEISNSATFVLINADTGNDSISNNSEKVTINAGAGDDEISNSAAFVLINADTGNDSITNNYGASVTINAGAGNDYIENNGENVLFQYAGGSDIIQGFNETSTLQIMAGNIGDAYFTAEDAVLKIGSDILTLKNFNETNKINVLKDGKADVLTIEKMSGTNEVDDFKASISNLLIQTFGGDDTVTNSGNSSTIDAGTGNDSVSNSGASVLINAGGGSDIVENYADNAEINGDADNDTISNYIDSNHATIDGGDGNDEIHNWGLSAVLNGGIGDDSIENFGDNISITGGEGDDSIYSYAENVTINSGKGNDTIDLYLNVDSKNLIQYDSGDGDDVITALNNPNSAIIAVDLTTESIGGYSTTADNDLVLKIGDGSLTFKNADTEIVSVKTSTSDSHVWNGASIVTIKGSEGNNIIENKGSSVTIEGGKGNDTVTLSSEDNNGNTYVYSAGDGKDVIYNFSSNDTIKIADNSKANIAIKGNDVIVKVDSDRITLKNAAAENTTITFIDSDDKDIESISGYTYTKAGVAKDGLIELISSAKTYTATDGIYTVDGSKNVSGVSVTATVGGSSLVGGTGNDTITGSETDSDILTGKAGKDVFVYNGGNDTITDYEKKDRISIGGGLSFASFTIDDDKNLILNFDNYDSLTINKGENTAITTIKNGKKVVNFYTEDGIFDSIKSAASLTGSATVFSAKNYSELVTIDGSAADSMEIIGNKKSNIITASANFSTLSGGKGKDTLIGGEGTDIFVYEKNTGKDVIQGYGEGDRISLGSGVEITDGFIQTSGKKSDAFIKFGNGSFTVKDTATVTLTSATGTDTIFSNGVFVSESAAKVIGSYKGTVSLSGYEVSTFDASLDKKALTIYGTDSADSIVGGTGKDKLYGNSGDDYLAGGKGNDTLDGGEGADSLWGGKGNDLLIGGDGANSFIFCAGDGNDTIQGYNFKEHDMLQILDKRGKASVYNKAVFSGSNLTLSVKGGGKITFAGAAEGNSFNINGTDYTISGKKLIQK